MAGLGDAIALADLFATIIGNLRSYGGRRSKALTFVEDTLVHIRLAKEFCQRLQEADYANDAVKAIVRKVQDIDQNSVFLLKTCDSIFSRVSRKIPDAQEDLQRNITDLHHLQTAVTNNVIMQIAHTPAVVAQPPAAVQPPPAAVPVVPIAAGHSREFIVMLNGLKCNYQSFRTIYTRINIHKYAELRPLVSNYPQLVDMVLSTQNKLCRDYSDLIWHNDNAIATARGRLNDLSKLATRDTRSENKLKKKIQDLEAENVQCEIAKTTIQNIYVDNLTMIGGNDTSSDDFAVQLRPIEIILDGLSPTWDAMRPDIAKFRLAIIDLLSYKDRMRTIRRQIDQFLSVEIRSEIEGDAESFIEHFALIDLFYDELVKNNVPISRFAPSRTSSGNRTDEEVVNCVFDLENNFRLLNDWFKDAPGIILAQAVHEPPMANLEVIDMLTEISEKMANYEAGIESILNNGDMNLDTMLEEIRKNNIGG